MKKVKDKSTMADLANLVISKRLDRIERMLKHQIIQKKIEGFNDFIKRMRGDSTPFESGTAVPANMKVLESRRDKLQRQLPDISDIFKAGD